MLSTDENRRRFTVQHFYEEAYDERFLSLIREFDNKGKYIASICVGALHLSIFGLKMRGYAQINPV